MQRCQALLSRLPPMEGLHATIMNLLIASPAVWLCLRQCKIRALLGSRRVIGTVPMPYATASWLAKVKTEATNKVKTMGVSSRHELQSSVGQSHVAVRKTHTDFCTLNAATWPTYRRNKLLDICVGVRRWPSDNLQERCYTKVPLPDGCCQNRPGSALVRQDIWAFTWWIWRQCTHVYTSFWLDSPFRPSWWSLSVADKSKLMLRSIRHLEVLRHSPCLILYQRRKPWKRSGFTHWCLLNMGCGILFE